MLNCVFSPQGDALNITNCTTATLPKIPLYNSPPPPPTDRNGLKQGDALSPLLFNFTLECAIRRVQVNQDGFKLNGTHQILAYADDVNILGGSSIHTLKENAEALVAATR